MAISDVIDQLLAGQQPMQDAGPPLVIAPQADSTPLAVGAPMDITSSAQQAAMAAPAKPSKIDDWTLPAMTMTPPSVANVPFGRSSGMIAPQPAPPMLGDILTAPPAPAPRRYVAPMVMPT